MDGRALRRNSSTLDPPNNAARRIKIVLRPQQPTASLLAPQIPAYRSLTSKAEFESPVLQNLVDKSVVEALVGRLTASIVDPKIEERQVVRVVEKLHSFAQPKKSRSIAGLANRIQLHLMPIRKNSFRWLLPRAPQRRLIFKSGECNVSRVNINKRGRRYLADIFTTLVDIKWRWNLLIFTLAFTLSWVIFGLIWWLICFSHGDMAHQGQEDWKPCVAEVHDFTTALLFSIETQQTIGYGVRFMNPHCPVAIAVVMFQSCFGIIIQALMTGLVFAKLSRPKKRAQTLMFSQNAVICERDGQLCFLFRVGDMRKSNIVEAHIRAIMVDKKVTREGEVLPLYQRDLQLSDNDTDCRLFLVWPLIVEHKITAESPFWEISADNIRRRQFEVLVILEGIVESTGMTTQARTSYLPSEVLWGHRFERLVSYQRESGQYLIDYSRFNYTTPVETSPSSAKERWTMNRNNNGNSDDDDDDDDTVSDDSPNGAGSKVGGPGENSKLLSPSGGGGTVRGREPSISIIAASRTNVMESVALTAFGLNNEFPSNSDYTLPITDICEYDR